MLINSLHSHLHLSLFQRCLLLQTLASNLHLRLQVSCHFICLFSLVFEIKLNTLTFMFLTASGKYNFANGSLILLQLPLHSFTYIKVHYRCYLLFLFLFYILDYSLKHI